MISSRLAYRFGRLHKWLGLIVGLQVLIWVGTGLFFTSFPMTQVKGEHLWTAPSETPVDRTRVTISLEQALDKVVEDRPLSASLRMLGPRPIYEIRGEVGVFLVSAETGEVLSPLSEDLAREAAQAAWKAEGALTSVDWLEEAPMESRGHGPVWAARFEGPGRRTLYVWPNTGVVGPVRTDLWRTYDFFWSLHIMDYTTRESFNHPLIIAAAVLALSLVLFGVALVLHRFTRGLARNKGGA